MIFMEFCNGFNFDNYKNKKKNQVIKVNEHESFIHLLILFCNINYFLGGRSFPEVSTRGHSPADRSGEQE